MQSPPDRAPAETKTKSKNYPEDMGDFCDDGNEDRQAVLLGHLQRDAETFAQNEPIEPEPVLGGGSLDKLIYDLQQKIKAKDPSVSKIKHPEMLIDSLTNMNDMIGMDRLKEAVALQVMRLIDALNSGQNNLGMLNTILYGDPGVGKTRVGILLAKIWYSLGFLDNNVEKSTWIDSMASTTGEEFYSMAMIAFVIGYYVWLMLKLLYNNLGFMWLCIILALALLLTLGVWWWWKKRNEQPQHQGNNNIGNNVTASDEFDRSIINVVSRRDFVGDYVGQTAGKTKRLLEENRGKVLFIDEAYSLMNSHTDPYGIEALTTLNLFLSENENKIVVIFAGYKDLMQDGIFRHQPGLPRRCMWHFECDGYDGDQLGNIFLLQLREQGWSVSNEQAVKRVISKNRKLFSSFGGDTKRLIFFAQLAASRNRFYSSEQSNNVLTIEDITEGIQFLQENNIQKDRSSQSHSEVPSDLPEYYQQFKDIVRERQPDSRVEEISDKEDS